MKWNELLITHGKEKEAFRYRVLDHISKTKAQLNELKLFPIWDDIYTDYKMIKSMHLQSLEMLKCAKKEWVGFNEWGDIEYAYIQDDAQEIVEIVADNLGFARDELKNICRKSEDLRKSFQSAMKWEPIGIITPNVKEGLLMLSNPGNSHFWCWKYQMGFQKNSSKLSLVQTMFMGKYTLSLSNSMGNIKSELAQNAGFGNQYFCTWFGESGVPLPPFSSLKQIGIFKLIDTVQGFDNSF